MSQNHKLRVALRCYDFDLSKLVDRKIDDNKVYQNHLYPIFYYHEINLIY